MRRFWQQAISNVTIQQVYLFHIDHTSKLSAAELVRGIQIPCFVEEENREEECVSTVEPTVAVRLFPETKKEIE